MRKLGDILAVVGVLIFVYTVIGRFIGEKTVFGFSRLPVVGVFLKDGFSACGMLSGTSCLLLIAVIIFLKTKD
ncbi:MAG: hypothetical protein KAS86_00915 [Candidatus Omnitrophica bacterium]|nr:hypothetical protein [Candidatus Omnitrophota bacterium]